MENENKRLRVGDRIAPRLRRIGDKHAVVTLGTSVQLLDVRELDRQIAKLTRQLASLEEERVKCQAKIDELRGAKRQFEALDVDRDDDDPDVEQPVEQETARE